MDLKIKRKSRPIELTMLEEVKLRLESFVKMGQPHVCQKGHRLESSIIYNEESFSYMLEAITRALDEAIYYVNVYNPDEMFEIVSELHNDNIVKAKRLSDTFMEDK